MSFKVLRMIAGNGLLKVPSYLNINIMHAKEKKG